MGNQAQETQKILASYGLSDSPQEIIDAIQRSQVMGHSLLWQNHARGRTVFQVQALELDTARQKVRVAYDGPGDLIDPSRPVYAKISFRETVFKGEVYRMDAHEVVLHLPLEVRMREFRETLRTSFSLGEKTVDMRPHLAYMRPDQLPTLRVWVRDLSIKGLGLYLSDQNLHLFRKDKFIDLVALGETGLPRGLLGQVVYAQRQGGRQMKKGMEMRVGVRMLDPIPQLQINAFTAGQKQRMGPSEALLKSDLLSPEFQEMLAQEVSQTLKKLRQRPAIAKYLNQLEVLRGQDDYLPEHINVLGIVCTFMARALGWVSEASLEKFVYAAHMHDAPFFAYPRLARIRDLKDFAARRVQLSAEEQKIFLGAPEAAAAIALTDTAAPPDVAQMLLMQKEMPDGSGFPHKAGHSRIPPMAALFIVAHALTEEIMQNREWELGPWLTKARKVYVGGHFNKVMTALESAKISLRR